MTQPDDRLHSQAPVNQKGAHPQAKIELLSDHIERDKQAPLRIEDFEYELPAELIAQQPLPVRHQSRLLHLDRRSGAIQHLQFENIVELLEPGDVLVVNNTKVIPARLTAKRKSGRADQTATFAVRSKQRWTLGSACHADQTLETRRDSHRSPGRLQYS